MADGDFRDDVKCACPRIDARDCMRARHPAPFDDFERAEFFAFCGDDDCPCRCHDLRAEWERDLEDEQAEEWGRRRMASRAELARRRRKRAKARQRERKAARTTFIEVRRTFDLAERLPIQQPAGLGTTPEALPLEGNEAAGLPPGAPGNGMGHSGEAFAPEPAPGVSSRAGARARAIQLIALCAALGISVAPERGPRG